MPKGKAKIKFIGGFLYGTFEDNIESRGVISEMSINTGVWYREDEDNVQIIKGGNLDDQWIGIETHLYKKGSKDKDGYFEYNFFQSEVAKRCSSITKTGKQCMKTCYKDLSVCEIHKK